MESEDRRALDFKATTSLLGALKSEPVSYAKDVQGNREALEKARFRTEVSNATWVPKKEREQAETDVNFLTKTAWHIGHGYNIGVGYSEQHGWDTLGTNLGKAAPRQYEYAGLTVKSFTKSSGPYFQDQRKDHRVEVMEKSKKERHAETKADLEKRIRLINDSLEPVVVEMIQSLRSKLKENEDTIEQLFMQLADEYLTRIDMAQLQGVWSDYQEQSKLREMWISEFEEQTEQLEVQRAALVQNELKQTAIVLLDIAHELRGPIERFLEEQALAQNKIVINNRRAYADMMSRLRRTEIERDKKARIRWEDRKQAWYLTLHDRAVAKCRAILNSKNYSHPKKRDTLYGALRSQQVILFERRVNMWMDLQSLVPPSLTSDKAKIWKDNIEQLDQEQDLEHKQRCGALRKFENEHYESSKQIIENMKKELKGYAEMTDAPMPSDDELAEASKEFEELIQSRKEKGLESVKQVSETLHLQLEYLKVPGIRFGGLIEVVARVVEDQEKRVSTTRTDHSTSMTNLEEENRLSDIKLEDEHEYICTQMRQDPTVENLRKHLPEALEALDRIKAEYRRYYDACMDQTNSFDSGMKELLEGIEDDILVRLGLSREEVSQEEPEEPAEPKDALPEDGEPKEEEEPVPIVYDDEEVTSGEEYDFVTLMFEKKLWVVDRRAPEHPHEQTGILAIPHKTQAEIEEEERKKAEEEEEGIPPEEEPPAPEPEPEEEEGEEGEEKPVKFVPDAMVSPINPFSAWGNEPLLEILEIPINSLMAIRRTQRRALLEYKQEQDRQITEATEKTVKEQQESLTVQLDERLRQWAPRPGRAEMDVYEVRDTQLSQHASRVDRHVGALSVRAASQQQHYGHLMAEAERELKAHCQSQRQRVKSLEMATNTSQLGNYERIAKLESVTFCEAVQNRVESMNAYATEALHALQRMNKQFLDSCYLFEELGGKPDGTYNPEEVAAYKERLSALDADAEDRYAQWVEYGKEMMANHEAKSAEELQAFHEAIKNVETDISLLEAVDKEVRSCSLQQQQELTTNDACIDALDRKIVELESLCSGASQSTLGSIKSVVADEEEEAEFQGKPLSVQILQTLSSIRWRVLHRATFMQCLQSQLELDSIQCVPPIPPEWPEAPEIPEPEEEEADPLEPVELHAFLWPKPPEDEEGAEESKEEEEEAPPKPDDRFPLIGKEDKVDETPHLFTEAIDKIQATQTEALEALVAKYFEDLGDREITRKEGDPACTAERFIPGSVEDFNTKNEARLSELRENAMQTLKAKLRYFRSLVARLSTAMGRVPAAVFGNISDRYRRRARTGRRALEDQFIEEMAAWMKLREENNQKLKPSLGNSNARKELDDLCDAETARYEKAIDVTRKTMMEAMKIESTESWAFFHEVVHATQTILTLFDSIVQPADLIPTDEDVIAKRKTLLTLMREYTKQESGTAKDPPPEGKAFHSRPWRGLRVGELGPHAVYGIVSKIEHNSALTAKSIVSDLSETLTDGFTSNDTSNHATAIKMRDRSYNQFRLYFTTQTERGLRHYRSIEREEQRWRKNWTGLVESLKD